MFRSPVYLGLLADTTAQENKRLEKLKDSRDRLEAERLRIVEALRQTDIAITATRSALDVLIGSTIDEGALTLELGAA